LLSFWLFLNWPAHLLLLALSDIVLVQSGLVFEQLFHYFALADRLLLLEDLLNQFGLKRFSFLMTSCSLMVLICRLLHRLAVKRGQVARYRLQLRVRQV